MRGNPNWVTGVSGNPSGRTKDPTKALARQYGEEAIGKLVEWMRSENPKASISACSILLDRGFGKPDANINLGLNDDIAAFLVHLGAAPAHTLELEAEPDELRDTVPRGNA